MRAQVCGLGHGRVRVGKLESAAVESAAAGLPRGSCSSSTICRIEVRASTSDAALAVCSVRSLSDSGGASSERTNGGAAPFRAASTKCWTASGLQPPATATAA